MDATRATKSFPFWSARPLPARDDRPRDDFNPGDLPAPSRRNYGNDEAVESETEPTTRRDNACSREP